MNILINLLSSLKNSNNPFHGGNEYTNRIINDLVKENYYLKRKLFFFCSSELLIDKDILELIKNDKNSNLVFSLDYKNISEAIERLSINKFFDPLGVNLNGFSLEKIDVIYTIHGLRYLEMPTDINEYYLESKIKYLLKTIFFKSYMRKVVNGYKNAINIKAKTKKIIVLEDDTAFRNLIEIGRAHV
jgi:hypothetical protein